LDHERETMRARLVELETHLKGRMKPLRRALRLTKQARIAIDDSAQRSSRVLSLFNAAILEATEIERKTRT
jgi:hypothetical protein